MSEVKNVLFIINKYSGMGYQPQVEGKMLNACEKFDIECSIEFTQHRGHATELAREGVAKNFNRVIAVGGDGTVNEVARGLLHTATPMGIIPKGSGNGLARHLGISMKLEKALNQILGGEVIQMDTFKMNDHLSLNVSGIGFDGHVANLFSVSQRRGFWGYSKLVLKEYLSYPEFEASLHLNEDPGSSQKSFMIAIANSSQYGNNAKVAPIASVMDQALQLAIIKKVPAQRGFHFGYQMFTGNLKTGVDYKCLSFRKGTIHVPTPTAYHIDGEPFGHSTSFKIELLPRSLHLVIPTESLGKI
ncbi:MAG TPA: YegS/Rv2252/BmrU family lipid kinase [Cyclobacteriaceae bacterium]|nr:YegS/Rv2252/BmrU family lipid kinase [Cyclobacteriaceae bacterium]